MRKYLLLILLFSIHWIARGQTQYEYRYWIDGDESTLQSGTLSDSKQTLEFDVKDLQPNFHFLHFQVKGKEGKWSSVKTAGFLKKVASSDLLDCDFWVDGSIRKSLKLDKNHGFSSFEIDFSDLKPGLHQATAYVRTSTGAISGLRSSYFYRVLKNEELQHQQLLYGVDGGSHLVPATMLDDGTYHIDLDVSALQDGLHCLAYALVSPDGTVSNHKYRYFYKVSAATGAIAKYEYFVNGDEENKQTVKVQSAGYPYQLAEDLLVAEYPIRSKSFSFAVEDGCPLIYAKNDFGIRFTDMVGNTTEETASFVDLRSRKMIEITKLLQEKEEHLSLEKPSENSIIWYAMNAKEGNEILVKTDMASTLQIFSPSGEEVYAVSDDKSLEYGGLTVEEEGTYYIALHDVANHADNQVTFSYLHTGDFDTAISSVLMDKKAFVDIYSTQGVLVRKHVKAIHALDGLAPGVYIINNEKVVVK